MSENISAAIKFLSDPKVQSAPLAKRIAFLESKGLSQSEIQEALAKVNGNAPTAEIHNIPIVNAHPQQIAQPYDWKDYTLALASIVGLGYAGTVFFQV